MQQGLTEGLKRCKKEDPSRLEKPLHCIYDFPNGRGCHHSLKVDSCSKRSIKNTSEFRGSGLKINKPGIEYQICLNFL